MAPPIVEPTLLLIESLHGLTRLWENLTRENLEFSSGKGEITALQDLLDQRELALEEARMLERQIVEEATSLFAGEKAGNLGEVIRLIEGSMPNLKPGIIAFRQALTQLVNSDKTVEKKLKASRDSIETQIKTLRRSSALLKGYKQSATENESCFFDKIK